LIRKVNLVDAFASCVSLFFPYDEIRTSTIS